jgi:hypothetical protein
MFLTWFAQTIKGKKTNKAVYDTLIVVGVGWLQH